MSEAPAIPAISDEYAAELVARIEADMANPAAPLSPTGIRDMLILKLWAKVQALEGATGFLGGGIKPIGRSPP